MNKRPEIDEASLKDFLATSLFYPASDLDPTPLLHTFTPSPIRNFVYADYGVGECGEGIGKGRARPFAGFKVADSRKVQPRAVLGYSWAELKENFAARLPVGVGLWDAAPCIYEFLLHPEVNRRGREANSEIRLLFLRLEATVAYRTLYGARSVAPLCIANLRSGLGKGGNYPAYPEVMSAALRANPAGLPQYLLNEERIGGRLRITPAYRTIARPITVASDKWGPRHLTLRQLRRCPPGARAEEGACR